MDENKVRQIVSGILHQDQYSVPKVPFHVHNGTDSLQVSYVDILNTPNTFCVATTTNGTTAIPIFTSTGTSFPFTITGVYLIANDTTASNITLSNNGNTVATIAKGTTAGAMTGATSLANTAYVAGTPITVVSSATGNATVFMTFTT